jgi:hypothetical protein
VAARKRKRPKPPRTPAKLLPDCEAAQGIERKRCTQCGKWKRLGTDGEFTYRKRYLDGQDRWVRTPTPMCKRCEADRQLVLRAQRTPDEAHALEQAKWQRVKNNPKRLEEIRRYSREWHTDKRRKQGVKERILPYAPDTKVPAAPLLNWIAQLPLSLAEVEQLAGLGSHTLGRNGRLQVRTVDQVLTVLDRPDVFVVLYPNNEKGNSNEP